MTDLDPTVFGHFKDALNTVIDQSKDAAPTEHPAKVVGRDEDGTLWARLYGSEKDTPITMSVVDASEGDLVGVKIVDGNSIMTWNTTSPAATVSQLEALAKKASTAVYPGSSFYNYIEAETAKIHYLTADELHSSVAFVDDLYAENITADDIISDHGSFQTLEADYGDFKDLVTDDFIAVNANIQTLNTNKANVSDLTATNAVVDSLSTKLAGIDISVINTLEAGYANINFANVNVANVAESWIKNLMVKGEIIAQSGNVFYLDAIQVNAANVTAGTLDVERLVVTEYDQQGNPHKYLVSFHENSQGQIVTQHEEISGANIEDRTLAANKLIVNSITTDEITVNDLRGTGGWINLHDGTFKYMTVAQGHESYTEEQKWAASPNGIWWDGSHLQIKADDISFTSGDSISSMVQDIEANDGNIEAMSTIVNQTASQLSLQVVDLQTVSDQLDSLESGDVADLRERVFETIPAYLTFGLDSNGNPLLTIGGGDDWGNFKLEISNTGLYIKGLTGSTETTPAYFDKDSLYIQEAEVVGNLYFGDWVWTARANGHMTLVKQRQ